MSNLIELDERRRDLDASVATLPDTGTEG